MKDKISINQLTKEFLNIKSEEAQAVFSVYLTGEEAGDPPEKIKTDLIAFLTVTYGFPSTSAKKIATTLYNNFSKGVFQSTLIDAPIQKTPSSTPDFASIAQDKPLSPSESPNIMVTAQDFQKFIELTQADPEITVSIKKLLLSFIVFYRRNFHPSGWIRYDKKNIFYLAGANKFSVPQQEKMTNFLHTRYALNMRVVGSNQPTPCYGITWLQEEAPAGSESNPYLTLAPLTPEGLAEVIDKIK